MEVKCIGHCGEDQVVWAWHYAHICCDPGNISGYIIEDVHSELLKDWYPILLIVGYNVFDLVGKSLTAVYLLQNAKVVVGSCITRLLVFPLSLGCLHGTKFFQTKIPMTILTCLLGLTNGYLTSVLMILVPKSVKFEHAETTGIMSVLFLVFGLANGSVIAWFWVIDCPIEG